MPTTSPPSAMCTKFRLGCTCRKRLCLAHVPRLAATTPARAADCACAQLRGDNRKESEHLTKTKGITFPGGTSRETVSIVNGFLSKDPRVRLGTSKSGEGRDGFETIRHHAFFKTPVTVRRPSCLLER